MKISAEIREKEEELIALRRDFHMHPEIGLQEFRTSEIVLNYLKGLGLDAKKVAQTGVVATLYSDTKTDRTIILRADMDALMVQEENDLPYKSLNDGFMHACGHDGHTAILLIVAKTLCENRENLKGNVKFVFQPNEEVAGAGLMVAEGVLENPRVEASFGLHLWSPLKTGVLGVKAGPIMAEMYNFKITLSGKDGHTSAPDQCIDPIICAANIIQSLQTIQTREINSLKPTNIMFGKISGGSSTNVIPKSVELIGSLRYLYDGGKDSPECPMERMKRIVEGICLAHRIQAEIEFEVSNYLLSNDERAIGFMKDKVLPKMDVRQNEMTEYQCLTGEDFSEFSNHNGIPGAFLFVGTGNREKETDKPHHCSRFNIDEDSLMIGAELLKNIALEYFD